MHVSLTFVFHLRCVWDGKDCLGDLVKVDTDMGRCVAFNARNGNVVSQMEAGDYDHH